MFSRFRGDEKRHFNRVSAMAPITQRKRKRIANQQQNHNICPDTEMATGEEEKQQQLLSGGVSTKKAANPIVFPPPPPRQLLDIAAHEGLLTRLGLWDFLNLDLGEAIRGDLIEEVVVSYKYNPRKFTGESRVKDVSISLDRTAVTNALRLPVERVGKGGSFPVSEEESSFLEKLFWGHLVLKDDGEDANHYVLEFVKALKGMQFDKADWAGLLWCLMQRELLKGRNLVKCYYASHLQLVLKHQRPELFDDDQVTEGGSMDGVCQSDSLNSLEKGAELLLNLQVDLNAEFHSSEIEDEVMQNEATKALFELLDAEMDHNGGRIEVGMTQSDKEDDAQKLHKNDIYSENYELVGKRVTDHTPQTQQEVDKYEDICQPEGIMLQDCTTADHSILFQPLPQQLLDIAAHKSLLTCLGLWDFVNLEFDQTIREDLMKELVVSYEYGKSCVTGVSISLDRTAVANALCLPVESFVKGGSFPVSKEEGSFLEELFWGYLVLIDDGEDAPMMSLMSKTYVTRFAEILKERRFEEADWASLVWFMMECELLKGKNLVKCYYASHLQLVLKHLRPELFDDDDHEGEVVGSTDEDSEIQSVGFSDEDDEHCADLAGRELGGDDQVTEVGNLDGVCQSDTVDSLENGAKLLLNLQIDLNAEIHSSENEDDLMQNEANKAACYTCTDNAPNVHSAKEDFMVLDEGDEGVRKTSSDNALKVSCLKEDYVVQYEGSEAHTGKSADVHSEKKDAAMQDEENEAAFEADTGNSLDVHYVKDNLTDGKENEADISDLLNIAQDHHQPEFKLMNAAEENRDNLADFSGVEMDCQEVHLNCMADHTRMDVESTASVDGAYDSGMKNEGSYDGLDNQEIENRQKEVNIIDNQHQSEPELINATEMNRDSIVSAAGDAMNCQEVDMNCVPDNAGMEEEHGASVALLVAQEAQDEVVRKDTTSTDGLDSQETENQQKKVEIHYKAELEFKTAVEMNGDSITDVADVAGDEMDSNAGMEVESGTCADLLIAQEGSTNVLDTQKIENRPGHLGSLQENSGNKLSLDISEEEDKHCIQHKQFNISDEFLDVEMYHNGGTELGLTQSDRDDNAQVQNNIFSEKYGVVGERATNHAPQTQQEVDKYEDKCVAEGFLLQHCTTVDHSFVVPSSYTYLETAPSVHGNAVGNESRGHVSLGHFASETDMGLSIDGCNFGVNVQSGHAAETSMMIGVSDEHHEDLMDLDICAKQVEVWASRFTNSAKRKVEENHNTNMMLQEKIQEQNHLIEQYELMLQNERQQKQQYEVMLQKERQQKQTSDHRYDRELHLMQSVVEDYMKAFKETNNSFAKYRERVQLPEEPLYMPHPDGGGNVILVSEWKKLEKQRQEMAMQAVVDGFENKWSAFLEVELNVLNQYCDRLEGLEHDVKTMTERL